MDVLQSAAGWLAGIRDAAIAQQVVYRRGTQHTALAATFGQSLLKVSDGHGGVKVERTERDFLITAARLNFGGGMATPQRGDWIDVTTPAGAVLRYEVAAPHGEPEFRRADPYGITLRVHCKFRQQV